MAPGRKHGLARASRSPLPEGKGQGEGEQSLVPPTASPARPLAAIIGSLLLLVFSPSTTTATDFTKTNWWSLKPLERPSVPRDPHAIPGSDNPIDAFIQAKLAEKQLHSSPEADRPTLIRRLHFDLLGLPPTPGEIEAFIHDPDPLAYERLVDRLLASPHYGERWARHWLDVVHYGDTHGYDKDKPRPNAWPYRDYVIRAFNADKPYARFVQEQLAGDVLFPFTRDGIEALGFIAAGPWDLIGHEEVPESKIDGKVARHLDRDDMVANTMQTFTSFTVHCAQCHNHKFDPITQEDYYSLQAVFAALDRTNKKYDTDPAVARKRAALGEQLNSLNSRKTELDHEIVARAGQPLTDLDARISALEKDGQKSEAFGYHSAIEKSPDAPKWLQVDLGHSANIARIVLHPCKDDFNNIGEGFGFPLRFKIEVADDAEFKKGVELIADQTREDLPNPRIEARTFGTAGRTTRHVRVTATKLALRQDDYIFALAELEVFDAAGTNLAQGADVSALDSIDAPRRWQKSNLTDGWYPGASSTNTAELAALRNERAGLLTAATREPEGKELAELERALDEAKAAAEKLPPQSVVYAGAVHTGTGSFAGTGANGGRPRPVFILNRGNVQKPGQEVGPGALQAVAPFPARFALPPNHPEGERRAALAKWLTDPSHPLTWRSIVNRIWQYHFGRGLVETPNDFGRMGALPTHPELLDWLAVEFRDGGQSLKKLHKLIVTSAVYRQSSAGNADLQKLDTDNRFLWRMNRRKLEAEEIRDSVLLVAGKLDLAMGGPGFQDFVVDKPDHSPHYEYQLHDPEDPKSHRRSVYRFIVRSQPQPLMSALDCADPSMQVGKRNESVSPLQALALLNNALMLTMSKHFAAKLERGTALPGAPPTDTLPHFNQQPAVPPLPEGEGRGEGKPAPPIFPPPGAVSSASLSHPPSSNQHIAAQVSRGYYEAIGHPPAPKDLDALAAYAGEFGLTNLCRVLFNLNEFAFVD